MILPKITAVVLGLFLISGLQGQTNRDSLDLRRDLHAYHLVSKSLNYDSILYFMPPAFFTVVPQEVMKSTLKSTFENEEFTMGFDTLAYTAVSPLVKIGNQVCAMVHYDMRMYLVFSENQDSSFKAMMTGVFAETFGKDYVRESAGNSSKLEINIPGKKMFALREPEWDSWKFLEDKRGMAEPGEQYLLDAIVPKPVQDFFR